MKNQGKENHLIRFPFLCLFSLQVLAPLGSPQTSRYQELIQVISFWQPVLSPIYNLLGEGGVEYLSCLMKGEMCSSLFHFYFHDYYLLAEKPLSLPLLWCGCRLSEAVFSSSKEGVFRAWVRWHSPSLRFLPKCFQVHGRHCLSSDQGEQGKACGHGRMGAAHCSLPGAWGGWCQAWLGMSHSRTATRVDRY